MMAKAALMVPDDFLLFLAVESNVISKKKIPLFPKEYLVCLTSRALGGRRGEE